MEWNSAIHSPFGPKSRKNTGAMATAPSSSISRLILMIKLVRRTIPPTFGAEMASCMVLRCMREILLPEISAKDAATVITPIPPIWIRMMMTVCPNTDQ